MNLNLEFSWQIGKMKESAIFNKNLFIGTGIYLFFSNVVGEPTYNGAQRNNLTYPSAVNKVR